MAYSTTFRSLLLLSAVVVSLSSLMVDAFQTRPNHAAHSSSSPTSLHETCDGRRNFLSRGVGAAASILVGGAALSPRPAEASYTAYTQREEDWKTREAVGDIKFSNAAQLRRQLREIAPMNDEGSKLFCPNGPSSAVSPLMENKCGDRQALPSVYGRRDDAMGNSVPGFGGAANASTLRAELNAQSYFRANDDRK